MQLIFEQIRTGGDRNFAYLLADRDAKLGVVIDPSYTPEVVVQRAVEQDVRIAYIINTHSHPDHVNGNDKAVELTGGPVAAYHASPVAPQVGLSNGQELEVGALRLGFLHTPGHADDHLVVYEIG